MVSKLDNLSILDFYFYNNIVIVVFSMEDNIPSEDILLVLCNLLFSSIIFFLVFVVFVLVLVLVLIFVLVIARLYILARILFFWYYWCDNRRSFCLVGVFDRIVYGSLYRIARICSSCNLINIRCLGA